MNSQGAVECELTKHEWTDHSRSVDVQVKQVWVSTGRLYSTWQSQLVIDRGFVKTTGKHTQNTIVATHSLWCTDTHASCCSSIMPDVIGNFVEGDSHSVEGAAHFNNSIMSC